MKGFTLVELLIVVAIIGILSAIAIPQYAQYRADAVASKAESNISNCMGMVNAQYADNGTNELSCHVGETEDGYEVSVYLTLDKDSSKITWGSVKGVDTSSSITYNGTSVPLMMNGYTIDCKMRISETGQSVNCEPVE